MSGSVNALSYRLGSSMTWGYSTSPIFISLKTKTSILFSKLLPAVLRRFCLHVVEFYSFFDTSTFLFIIVSRLLVVQQRPRRRFVKRRSRKKKAFHRITYSLNKNFANWRILSFVRNSFRSYRKTARSLSFHFFNNFINFKFKYKKPAKRLKLGKKTIRFFKNFFFARKLKLKSLRKKTVKSQRAFFLILRHHHTLLKLPKLRFFLSPALLLTNFLAKKKFFNKRYIRKYNARLKRIRRRKNFFSLRYKKNTSFYKRRRFFRFRRNRVHRLFFRRKKSVFFYSFRALLQRNKALYRLFSIVFLSFW